MTIWTWSMTEDWGKNWGCFIIKQVHKVTSRRKSKSITALLNNNKFTKLLTNYSYCGCLVIKSALKCHVLHWKHKNVPRNVRLVRAQGSLLTLRFSIRFCHLDQSENSRIFDHLIMIIMGYLCNNKTNSLRLNNWFHKTVFHFPKLIWIDLWRLTT